MDYLNDRPTHTTAGIHLYTGGEIKGEATKAELEDRDPYAVVKLTIGHHELTVFPGARAGELAEALRRLADQLADVVAEIDEALVLTD